MSQICGMLKKPVIWVKFGITGQINRAFLAHNSVLHLTEVCHVACRGAPLEMTGGTKGGAQGPAAYRSRCDGVVAP
jgi:hypothetical protein